MKCQHKNADHLKPGEWLNLGDQPVHIVAFEQLRCLDCGAWLSLGSAPPPPYPEMLLAELLWEDAVLYEPGAAREEADARMIDLCLDEGATQYAEYRRGLVSFGPANDTPEATLGVVGMLVRAVERVKDGR